MLLGKRARSKTSGASRKSAAATDRAKQDGPHTVEQHTPLVHKIIGRLIKRLPRSVSYDDLFAAGLVGLWRATQRFDPGNGAAFSTYATYCIESQAQDWLRAMDWVSRYARSQGVTTAQVNLSDRQWVRESIRVSTRPQRRLDEQDAFAHWANHSRLTRLESAVLWAVYYEGLLPTEVARRRQCSRSGISHLMRSALAKLRDLMETRPLDCPST